MYSEKIGTIASTFKYPSVVEVSRDKDGIISLSVHTGEAKYDVTAIAHVSPMIARSIARMMMRAAGEPE
jgi:hypothetical protein